MSLGLRSFMRDKNWGGQELAARHSAGRVSGLIAECALELTAACSRDGVVVNSSICPNLLAPSLHLRQRPPIDRHDAKPPQSRLEWSHSRGRIGRWPILAVSHNRDCYEHETGEQIAQITARSRPSVRYGCLEEVSGFPRADQNHVCNPATKRTSSVLLPSLLRRSAVSPKKRW